MDRVPLPLVALVLVAALAGTGASASLARTTARGSTPPAQARPAAVLPDGDAPAPGDDAADVIADAEGLPAPPLTGLERAIDRVQANLDRHPNRGLRNALARLQANKARHDARRAGDVGAGASEGASAGPGGRAHGHAKAQPSGRPRGK